MNRSKRLNAWGEDADAVPRVRTTGSVVVVRPSRGLLTWPFLVSKEWVRVAAADNATQLLNAAAGLKVDTR